MLGAAEGVAETAKHKLEKSMPDIKIVGTYSPSFEELNDPIKNSEIIKQINDSEADILFVALGAPKQELWIYNNLEQLNPYVYIPCGGSIDFIAGVQAKSPEWLAAIGLEWLFRLKNNPRRMFKRYILQDLPFLIKLLFIGSLKQMLNIETFFKNITNAFNTNLKNNAEEKQTITKDKKLLRK